MTLNNYTHGICNSWPQKATYLYQIDVFDSNHDACIAFIQRASNQRLPDEQAYTMASSGTLRRTFIVRGWTAIPAH